MVITGYQWLLVTTSYHLLSRVINGYLLVISGYQWLLVINGYINGCQ